ncbi:MAG: peptide chain release factor 2 [Arsenophonus sp.]|nr:MAG: peptide chain release factor 2 [Arsenophonus sp.]
MFESHVIKNKIQHASKQINTLRGFFDYDHKKCRLEAIKTELKKQKIWKNFKQVKFLSQEYSSIEIIVKKINFLIDNLSEISEFFEVAIESNDLAIFKYLIVELDNLQKQIKNLEFHNIFSKASYSNNCYLDLQSGSGGIEAQDWTNMLMRMYLRWADSKKFKIEIIEISNSDISGVKSATIKIIGEYAYGWLRTETGVHRLVRKSPFDSNGRRHTSFSSIFVYPEIDDSIDVEINSVDLRIDVYKASGAGGQHVNKTESAVRITHIPTGIITQCQNDRSQHKNKEQALRRLKAKLWELKIQKKNADKKALEKNKADISWSNQIRSYVLDNPRIKDLRTGVENRNTQAVLDGDLDKFIEASLKAGL